MTPEPEEHSESTVNLAPGVWVREADLSFAFIRSSGPGGQAVNKVNSAVQMRLPLTAIQGLNEAAVLRLRRLAGQRLTRADELLFQARTHRSQFDNRRACLERLIELVAKAATPPKTRRKVKPTRGMIERRLTAKRRLSEKKRKRGRPREDDL